MDTKAEQRENASHTIQCDGGGYHVLWYCDDDGNSGNGDMAEEARWYGSRDACIERAKQPPPREDDAWVPVGISEGPPPYDAATATGMYDRL